MAGWLSSKLKAAEQILQQIDQQAAESLGKPEKQRIDDVGISVKDTRKPVAKAPVNSQQIFTKSKDILGRSLSQETLPQGNQELLGSNKSILSASEQNGKSYKRGKEKSERELLSPPQPLTDTEEPRKAGIDDWTELLASPERSGGGVSYATHSSSVGSSDTGFTLGPKPFSTRVPVPGTDRSHPRAKKGGPPSALSVRRASRVASSEFVIAKNGHPSSSPCDVEEVEEDAFMLDSLRRRLELDSFTTSIDGTEGLETGHRGTRKMTDYIDGGVSAWSDNGKEVHNGTIIEPTDNGEEEVSAIRTNRLKASHAYGPEDSQVPIISENNLVKIPNRVDIILEKDKAKEDGGYGQKKDNGDVVERESDNNPLPLAQFSKREIETGELGDLVNSRMTNGRMGLTLNMENSESVTESDSDSDSQSESEELDRYALAEERRAAKQKAILAAAAIAAQNAIEEHEQLVEKLEKERDALERTLTEREAQQAKEAMELQRSSMKSMKLLELEKQEHGLTRMKALKKESQLEADNGELARSLAMVQRNLDEQISQIVEIKRMIAVRESACIDLERKIARFECNDLKNLPSDEPNFSGKTSVDMPSFEDEQTDLGQQIDLHKNQVKLIEEEIAKLRNTNHVPTEREIELKNRLGQLTDQLIQKQAQVEALSAEKATLVFRLESLLNTLQEERSLSASSRLSRANKDIRMTGGSNILGYREDLEVGLTRGSYNAKLLSSFPPPSSDIEVGGSPLLPILRHFDALFLACLYHLRRHRWVQAFAVLYLLLLHAWVFFVLLMHSSPEKLPNSSDLLLPNNLNASFQ